MDEKGLTGWPWIVMWVLLSIFGSILSAFGGYGFIFVMIATLPLAQILALAIHKESKGSYSWLLQIMFWVLLPSTLELSTEIFVILYLVNSLLSEFLLHIIFKRHRYFIYTYFNMSVFLVNVFLFYWLKDNHFSPSLGTLFGMAILQYLAMGMGIHYSLKSDKV